MMKLLHSHKNKYNLPLSAFLILHRSRNPQPHKLTNPLRFPHRIPRRNPLRMLQVSLIRSRHF